MSFNIKGGSFTFAKQVEAPDASFDNYFSWLSGLNDKKMIWPYSKEHGENLNETKELYTYTYEDYWYGLIISGKQKLVQHKRIREDGKIIIKKEEIKGEPPVELNFFCIRRDSGKGVYSHYIGSYQFGQFIKDLWSSYRKFVELKKNAAKLDAKLPDDKITEVYSLKGKNESSRLYNPKTFKELVAKLNYMEEVRFSTYECDDEEDVPVGDILKSKYAKYKFTKDILINEEKRDWLKMIRSKAKKINDQHKIKYNGSIKGFDNLNNPLSIDFDSTMENHIEYEYDKIGDIDLDELFKHDIIQLIIDRLKDVPLFEKTK